jgi:hypothetical protein
MAASLIRAGLLGARQSYRNEHAWLRRNTAPIFAENNEFHLESRLHGHAVQINLDV